MKKFFTPFFLILLMIAGAGQAFGENPIKYLGKLDIKFVDLLSVDFMSLYNPVDTLGKVSQIWKLQLEMDKRIEKAIRINERLEIILIIDKMLAEYTKPISDSNLKDMGLLNKIRFAITSRGKE